jgi:tetratricopeptide (TPR) repeat protein
VYSEPIFLYYVISDTENTILYTGEKIFVTSVKLLFFYFVLTTTGCMELVRRSSTPTIVRTPQNTDSINKEVTPHKDEPPKQSKEQQNRIEKINSYALWCIDNNMWHEARSHIQRGLEIDSLSPSLHNNLAIIYEQMGKVDSAKLHYQRALNLKPNETPYKTNLQRMTTQELARIDTSKTFNLFDREFPERRKSQNSYPIDRKPVIGD